MGTNHISGTAAAQSSHFVGNIKSQHMDDQSPVKGAWFGSRDPF